MEQLADLAKMQQAVNPKAPIMLQRIRTKQMKSKRATPKRVDSQRELQEANQVKEDPEVHQELAETPLPLVVSNLLLVPLVADQVKEHPEAHKAMVETTLLPVVSSLPLVPLEVHQEQAVTPIPMVVSKLVLLEVNLDQEEPEVQLEMVATPVP